MLEEWPYKKPNNIYSRIYVREQYSLPAIEVFRPGFSQRAAFVLASRAFSFSLALSSMAFLFAAAFLASSFFCLQDLAGSASMRTWRRKALRTWMAPDLIFAC